MKKHNLLLVFLLIFIFANAQPPQIITSSATLPQGSVNGSGFTSTCPPAITGFGCLSNSLPILIPPCCSVVGINYSFNYEAIAPYQQEDGGFSIVTYIPGSCEAYSPHTGAFTCSVAASGICTNQNQSIWDDIQDCYYGSPCAGETLNFQLHLYRCVGSSACTHTEITAASGFTITIVGKTIGINSIIPTQTISQGDSVMLYVVASGGHEPVITWNPGGLSGSSVWVHPTDTTLYTVTVTDVCGCYTSTDSVQVNVHAPGIGINEINIGNWKYYPNPTHDKIIFENSSLNKTNFSIVLYDVFGRKIKEDEFFSSPKFEVSLNDFPPGVYFLKIVSGNEVVFANNILKDF